MKTKKIKMKLALNKNTIVNLERPNMKDVKGGTDSDFSCDTCFTFRGITCVKCNSNVSCIETHCFEFNSDCYYCPTGSGCDTDEYYC